MSGFGVGFRSLDDELPAVELPVTGRLPEWVDGTLLRNGPAKFEAGDKGFRHWFDGQAMLHRFAIDGGRVTYANRYLDTPSSRAARQEGRIGFQEFATDPCRSLFARFFTPFLRRRPVNANVNITRFGDRLVALTEAPIPVEFAPETLATVGLVGYDDRLGGQLSTAHPHQDPLNGDVINYVTHFSRRSEYRVYRQVAGEMARRELIGRHPVAEPAYMHSFALTRSHVVLVEFPLVVNPVGLLLSGRPFIENFRWRPERGTRFIVMDLCDGRVRGVFHGPAFFAFHHINAREEDGQIFLDICAYEDASIIDALYLDSLRSSGAIPQAMPIRYCVDLEGGSVAAKQLADESMELPRIAYRRHNAGAYRYAYGVGSRGQRPDDFFNQLVKLDVTDGSTRLWYEEGCYPGEPVFVPAPPDVAPRAEDEGIILSVVLRSSTESSYLLALDACSFEELARAEVPHAVPFGFHGVFV